MSTDAEFAASVRDLRTEPKLVTAVFRFCGEPGQEQEAAEAWAFELTYYFLRGVGEQPTVAYDPAAGVYTVSGPMQTTDLSSPPFLPNLQLPLQVQGLTPSLSAERWKSLPGSGGGRADGALGDSASGARQFRHCSAQARQEIHRFGKM